jgi:hypothetical protein
MRRLNQITTLIVHHSASPRHCTVGDVRRWHLEKGWSDIGYHWVIEEDGIIQIGRPVGRIGAHCRGHNTESVGVCVMGNNCEPGQEWLPDQVEGLKDLIYAVALVIPEIATMGHNQLAATACPGVDLKELLA